MEDIRFYDFEFNVLHIEPDLVSVNWQVYYNGIGQFEAHFPLSSELTGVVAEQPYLVAVQGQKAAVITGWQAAKDFAVFGRTCNWLFGKRIVPAFESKTEAAETLTRDLVTEAFSDTSVLVLADALGDAVEVTISQKDYRPLSEVVCECLDSAQLGHELSFEPKNGQWVYRVRRGKELPIVISEANRNAAETEYFFDCLDFCSCGWYRQQQEVTEDGTREDPVWTLFDEGEQAGIYRWECILSADTQAEVKQELAQKKKSEKGTVSAIDLRWHTDYELGDVVHLQIEKNGFLRTIPMRIVGVHQWYEEGVCGEQPMLEGIKN